MTAAAIATALAMKVGRPGICPVCAYPDSFVVQARDGRTLIKCHAGCDQTDVLAALRNLGLWGGADNGAFSYTPRPTAIKAEASGRWAVDIWARAVPPGGTLAEVYLRGRIPGLGTVPPTLRYAAALKHKPTGLHMPAMVAGVTIWPNRTVVAVHRTYLTSDGKKAPVSQPKMTLGPIQGGAVRLAPHGPVLAICEGIETGLAVLVSAGLPVWAALSTGGMRCLILPEEVREVVVCADNDAPGLEAAHAAAERWADDGRAVRIAVPDRHGCYFNDMLAEAA